MVGRCGLVVTALSLFAGSAFGEEVSSIARGGLLYDNWPKVLNKKAPSTPNPIYPKSGAYLGKSDYRCKECHGWDYMGKDGAYRTGKHKTGIVGVRQSAGKSLDAIRAVLKDKNHGFHKLVSAQDLTDLALFVAKGQVDMNRVIDRKTNKAKGQAKRGAKYYLTVCSKCHGADGNGEPKMDALGPLARKNPWEVLHKILNGQPDSEMPALRAFDLAIAVDILAFTQTLPD